MEFPHSATNDINCFYDGVPSLRCATFGMTGARKYWDWSSGRLRRPDDQSPFLSGGSAPVSTAGRNLRTQ